MTTQEGFKELTISLIAKNQRPGLLSHEFLRCTDIVPAEWELARPPVSTPQVAQVVFENGISLTAKGNQISLAESISDKTEGDIEIPEIAVRYATALPASGYEKIHIYIRQIFCLDGVDNDYVVDHLIVKGPWLDYRDAVVDAAVQLAYRFGDKSLILSANPGKVNRAGGDPDPAAVFTGAFQHEFIEDNGRERIEWATETLQSWQEDLTCFNEIVQERFPVISQLMPAKQ